MWQGNNLTGLRQTLMTILRCLFFLRKIYFYASHVSDISRVGLSSRCKNSCLLRASCKLNWNYHRGINLFGTYIWSCLRLIGVACGTVSDVCTAWNLGNWKRRSLPPAFDSRQGAYLKGVFSFTSLHYLWRSLGPFSLLCAQNHHHHHRLPVWVMTS